MSFPLGPPAWPAELDLDKSAAGYKARAAALMAVAARTSNPDEGLAIAALAQEWRNLAAVADWQEAMSTALEACGLTRDSAGLYTLKAAE